MHRDVKPENVLISDDGEVKLVDFGLVRAIAEAGITSTSVILGTAAYLSPEQVAGTPTGPRSDVHSAGIMAFELLTGTTPSRATMPWRWPASGWIAKCRPEHDHRRGTAAVRPLHCPGNRDRPHRTLRRRARHGRRTRRHRRRTGPAEIPGPCAEELGPARRGDRPPPTGRPTELPTRPATDPAVHPTPGYSEDRVTDAVADEADEDPEFPRQFAGIDIDDFVYARLRARRMVVFWVLAVLVLTGLVGVAAWTVGLNFPGLIGP